MEHGAVDADTIAGLDHLAGLVVEDVLAGFIGPAVLVIGTPSHG